MSGKEVSFDHETDDVEGKSDHKTFKETFVGRVFIKVVGLEEVGLRESNGIHLINIRGRRKVRDIRSIRLVEIVVSDHGVSHVCQTVSLKREDLIGGEGVGPLVKTKERRDEKSREERTLCFGGEELDCTDRTVEVR